MTVKVAAVVVHPMLVLRKGGVSRTLSPLVDATAVPADRGALGRYVDGLVTALEVAGADLVLDTGGEPFPGDVEEEVGVGLRGVDVVDDGGVADLLADFFELGSGGPEEGLHPGDGAGDAGDGDP